MKFKKETYTRQEVVELLDIIFDKPDMIIYHLQNENTLFDSSDIIRMAEDDFNFSEEVKKVIKKYEL